MSWRKVFANDELGKKLNEGIADETEGKAYWEDMQHSLKQNDMPAASDKALQFAQQEQGHHDLLVDVKKQWRGTF